MKRAIFGSLANLVMVGLVTALPAMAQDDFAVSDPDTYAVAPIEADPEGGYPVLEGDTFLEPSDGCGATCGGDVTFGDCGAGGGCAVCGGGNCPPSAWYLRTDVRVLNASKARGIELTKEFVGIQATVNALGQNDTIDVFDSRLGTQSVDFDVAAGYAMTLGRYLGRDSENRDQFLEFSYWGMNHWEVSRQVTGERITRNFFLDPADLVSTPLTYGALFSPFETSIGGFNRADAHEFFYDLEVHNWEANVRFVPRSRPDRLVLHPSGQWRRECTPGEYFSFMAGLRVMSMTEGFFWTSNGVVNVGGVDNPVSGEYGVLTHNDLFGFQIGGEYTVRDCRWEYGARVKAGPFLNFADQKSRAESHADGDPLATTPLDFRRMKRRDDVALLGEFGFFTSYKLRPNFILRASYDFTWVTGLARAPEQLIFLEDPPVDLNTNGITFFQGITLGLEWDF